MKHRFFTFLLALASMTAAWAQTQTAVLTRSGQPIAAYSGVDALKNAVTAAASGDVIVLSSGTFNECQVIEKSVSIYGQGFDNPSTRTFIKGRLQFRPIGEHSLDDIHLEGLSLESHLNLLNDGDSNPISNLTVEKCLIRGMFLYMNHDHTTIRNCVMQGDLKSYPGDYKATNMLIENCWKDGGSFNHFTTDSDITIKNSIFYCRSISGFDNSSAFTKADYQNCVIANCSLGANSTASNCVLIAVNTSNTGVATEGCYSVSSAASVYSNMSTLVYTDGTVPEIQSEYTGIGITGGTLGWSTTPSQPAINYTTTLTKDGDGYYLLGTKADWIEFKRVVEKMNPMANAKMTADIDLGDAQAMIGNGHYNNVSFRRAYAGIFDGQGHTLTIHFVTADILQLLINEGFTEPTYLGCGPFGYVCGGTIRNLNTAGTITSTHEGAAGLVAWTNGTVLIENCHSSVNIIFDNASRKRGLSGFTYNSFNDNHVLTIRDCVYDGTMTAGADKTGSAGFVIWRAYGTVNISNSLLAATYENGLGTSDCCTFVRNGLGGGVISNSYYKTKLGEAQGVQATEAELTNGRTAFYLQNGRPDLVWGQRIGVDPLPVLTTDESKRVYRSATGYTNDPSLAIADQSLVPLNYTIDGSGNLTITGFDPGFTPPADYALNIPDEIDDHPVVAIANSAFFQKNNFTSLHIGKNVLTIGNEAFRQAKGMVSVTFDPNGVVTTFGSSAFRGCDELTSFTMPNTVTTIGEMCFQADPKLATVTLSNHLTALAANTFNGCSVLDNVVIPASVTTVGNSAFNVCTSLTSITIPNTVTSMGTGVFSGCTSLASAVFADGCLLTTIPDNTFYQCALLNGFTIPSSVSTIGASAFNGCSGLTAITIPSSVTTINNSAFYKTGLTTVTLPSTITTMGSSCFAESALTSANVQCAILGANAFTKCASLASVTLASGVTNIGNNAFQGCSALSAISIPATVTTLGTSAFYQCSLLATVTFASGINLATIPASCFFECRTLQSVDIPASVARIDDEAFRRCSAMTSVNFPADTQVTSFGNGSFRGCESLTAFVMPNTVTTIGASCFTASLTLASITFSENLKVIAENSFNNCPLLNNVVIPASVTSIEATAFQNCIGLETIAFPASVKTIGNSAFRYCSSLNNVVLPGSLVTIQDWAFANCTAMENLTIEEGVTSINRDVFQFSGMKKVVLPSTLEFIGVNLFNECSQLEELDLSKCVNVYELYSMANVQRTGGSGQWNIFFGIPSTTKVILPPYATATLGANDEVASLPFDLQQDDEGYYLINTATDWDKFVVYSRQNPTINGRVTNHLNLTKHFGKLGVGNGESNYITYQGTLDAQGHTLSIKYKTGKDDGGGLLAYVENATVKNLRMTGEIMANNRHIGGIVGFVKPGSTLVMQDCESHADFTVTPTTTNMHIAGFIGQGKTSTITLTDCLFTGSVTGNSSFRYAAPFLGWMESAGRISYNNCLNNGTFTNTDPNYTYALGVTQSGGQSTATSCFYKPGNNTNNESLATAVSADQLASGMVTYRLQANRTEQHWGQLIGTDPAPRLTAEDGTLVYHKPGVYSNSDDGVGLSVDDEGYYLIGSVDEWKMLAMLVDDGEYDAKARMTKDIDLGDDQTMIGSGVNQDNYGTGCTLFKGIFDGQGHTLTVHYNTTELYVAPFRYIQNATIKNLRVDGTITTSNRLAGGIVSGCFGEQIHSYITNCISSVDITSNYVNTGDFYYGARTGGIAACLFYYGQLHITDCIFDGSISGENRGVLWGGFLGLPDGTVTIENCLQFGTFDCSNVISGSNGSGTFSSVFSNGYASRVNVSNCYYLNQLGNAQGTLVNASTLTDGTIVTALQAGRSESVWKQDAFTGMPMLTLFADQYRYKVPASGVGTFSAPCNIAMPDGLTAYTCQTFNQELSVISAKAINGVVPAQTGMLLRGEPGETYYITASDETPAVVEGNALVAVVEPTHVAPTAGGYTNFMLSNGKFIKIAAADETSKMPANKAYLQIPTADLPNLQSSIQLNWDDEATDFTPVFSPEDEGSWYDLNGRKLSHKPTAKGIYIHNGRRVVIK